MTVKYKYSSRQKSNNNRVVFTPSSQPIPNRSDMVKNSAGSYVFDATQWMKLDEFLILGAEGRTYYASHGAITERNTDNILTCIEQDGIRVVNRVVELSHKGLPKNETAVFVLALCASVSRDEAVRSFALNSLPKVARTATDLFAFIEVANNNRGWGRAFRRGISNWYLEKKDGDIAYQVLKYRNRNGWTHDDVLKLTHVKPETTNQELIFGWVAGRVKIEDGRVVRYDPIYNELGRFDSFHRTDLGLVDSYEALAMINAYTEAAQSQDEDTIVGLIKQAGLTWEMIPNQFLRSTKIWDALLDKMPLHAALRNASKMTELKLIASGSIAEKKFMDKFEKKNILNSRLHPITILNAMKAYALGKSQYSHGGSFTTWTPTANVIDKLNDAFYDSFESIPPLVTKEGKPARVLVAIDVSTSVINQNVTGSELLKVPEAAAAMAMVIANSQPASLITWAFDTQVHTDLLISKRQRLDDAVRKIVAYRGGGTECSAPVIKLTQDKTVVDFVVIFTDNETWANQDHMTQRWEDYRNKVNPNAKILYCQMVSNGYSLANPDDPSALVALGLDNSLPDIMTSFLRGDI